MMDYNAQRFGTLVNSRCEILIPGLRARERPALVNCLTQPAVFACLHAQIIGRDIEIFRIAVVLLINI